MKVRTTVLVAVAVLLVMPGFVLAEAAPQQPATQAPQEQISPATPQTTLPAQSAQPQGAAPLRVMVGKSLLINTTEQIKRISVTDPSVAYATPITPTQILVH
jgi:Flp pilus assembly secretin CpaC